MIDYVIEHMENLGVMLNSRNELEEITAGIRLYLLENGVPEHDTRDYFRQYLDRSLSRIDSGDLKQFFRSYPVISRINQICMEFKANGEIQEARRAALFNELSLLYAAGLGTRYIPLDEVNEILGKGRDAYG